MNIAGRLEQARRKGARLFRAPGRVNIIGEHTDYSEGLVLPVNTGLYTWIEAMPRDDRTVTLRSKNLDAAGSFSLDELAPPGNPDWIAYVMGVMAELEREGIRLPGADLEIDGEIPLGGGLSSSASLEVAVASTILGLAGRSLPAARCAALCQQAEQRYAGVNCGIMDQFSVAAGKPGRAMLLDCRTLESEFVELPDTLAMIVTDSGAKHELADSDYNDRRDDCAEATRRLAELDASVSTLRDVSRDLLETGADRLGEKTYRRSRHVVTEIERVTKAFKAIGAGDLDELGALVSDSHRSLRDDFEVSCEEIEALVAIADSCSGVFGSRMIGGGFGGCVLSIVAVEYAAAVAAYIGDRYGRLLGKPPWIHTVEPAASAGEVTMS
jgi:galactokinase